MDSLIISGMSGAGKSLAANVLEDIGYYCIDNMPVSLIPRFAELFSNSSAKYKKVAFVVDVRGGDSSMENIVAARRQLNAMDLPCRLLFLDCSNETLINRYKETRRRHPLDTSGDIPDAIARERLLMEPIKNAADYVIDTTALSSATLKGHIMNMFGSEDSKSPMVISVVSFGFKYGIPHESDMVFDVRFLENPFYIPALKTKSGLDKDVYDFVFSDPASETFSVSVKELLTFLIPRYIKEGKTSLVVSVGCTGGRHRSVALAERIHADLAAQKHNVVIRHRDIDKG